MSNTISNWSLTALRASIESNCQLQPFLERTILRSYNAREFLDTSIA